MTIITKSDNLNLSVILDNIVEITKGNAIYTSVQSYEGWHCINFRTLNDKLIQWDYGKTEDGKKTRDEEYERIISTKY